MNVLKPFSNSNFVYIYVNFNEVFPEECSMTDEWREYLYTIECSLYQLGISTQFHLVGRNLKGSSGLSCCFKTYDTNDLGGAIGTRSCWKSFAFEKATIKLKLNDMAPIKKILELIK